MQIAKGELKTGITNAPESNSASVEEGTSLLQHKLGLGLDSKSKFGQFKATEKLIGSTRKEGGPATRGGKERPTPFSSRTQADEELLDFLNDINNEKDPKRNEKLLDLVANQIKENKYSTISYDGTMDDYQEAQNNLSKKDGVVKNAVMGIDGSADFFNPRIVLEGLENVNYFGRGDINGDGKMDGKDVVEAFRKYKEYYDKYSESGKMVINDPGVILLGLEPNTTDKARTIPMPPGL